MPAPFIGVMPQNEDVPATAFSTKFPATSLVAINFDQRSPSQFTSSIPYICRLGAQIMAAGKRPFWSVPVPGRGQLEAINSGVYDQTYTSLAEQILAVHGNDPRPIYVRGPWEFGYRPQENAALDINGMPAPFLFAAAWRRMFGIMEAVLGDRMRKVWSPYVDNDQVVDFRDAYPGRYHVDVIAPDFYMANTFGHKPGQFDGWFGPMLKAVFDFGVLKGKAIGFGELGMDHNDYAPDLRKTIAMARQSRPVPLEFVNWWNNPQVVTCRLDDGQREALATEFATLSV